MKRYILIIATAFSMISCSKIDIDSMSNLREVAISAVLLNGEEAEILSTTRTVAQREVSNVESFEVGDMICVEQSRDGVSTYYYYVLSEKKSWVAEDDYKLMREDIKDGDIFKSHFIPSVYDSSNYSWQGDGEYPDIMRDQSVEITDDGLVINYTRVLNGKLRVIINTNKTIESVVLNSLIRLSYYTQSDSGMNWAQEYCSATQLSRVSDGVYEILLTDLPQKNIAVEVVADGASLVASTGDIEIEQGKVALLYLSTN